MIRHTVERRDGETVEIWQADGCPDNEEVNRLLDLQLNGIKSFYRALERDGKIYFVTGNARLVDGSRRRSADG
jgi:hypothetical protein